MKKIIAVICVFLMVFSLASCQENDGAPEGMKKISGDNVAYDFFVYTQWLVDEEVSNCAYYSATDRSNVSMSSYYPGQTYETVAEFYAACLETYEKDLNNFTLIKEGKTNMDMFDAYAIEYTFTFGESTYKVYQAMTLRDTIMYVFTYTSSPEGYDVHLEEALAMLAALKFAA